MQLCARCLRKWKQWKQCKQWKQSKQCKHSKQWKQSKRWKQLKPSISSLCGVVTSNSDGRVAQIVAAWLRENEVRMRKWRGNGERMRKWRENEEMKRDSLSTYISSFSLYFLPLYPFPIVKNYLILSQNVKYGTKNLSYALWENNSGSNLLRESSASCEGLSDGILCTTVNLSNYHAT